MSRKSKSAAKLRRRKDKRARKEAEKARYASYRDQGVNSKSKRFRLKRRRRIGDRPQHADGPCGNVGCQKCHPSYRDAAAIVIRPARVADEPRVMGGQYWCDRAKPKRAVQVLRVLPGRGRSRHVLVQRFDGREPVNRDQCKVRLDKFGTKYARIMAAPGLPLDSLERV